jgi:hypothetical protein
MDGWSRAAPVVIVLAAGCSSSPPAPQTPQGGPPPPAPVQRRPDGIRYGVAGGLGVGTSRQGAAPTSTPGLAALGSLWVGLSVDDIVVFALRVDAGGVTNDALGNLGLHLALFPAGSSHGPVGDLQFFADAALAEPLSQGSGVGASPSSSSTIGGVGRLGVAWERWRLGMVAVGPFLAGQFVRGGGDAQSAALGGVSASFSTGHR